MNLLLVGSPPVRGQKLQCHRRTHQEADLRLSSLVSLTPNVRACGHPAIALARKRYAIDGQPVRIGHNHRILWPAPGHDMLAFCLIDWLSSSRTVFSENREGNQGFA